MANQTQSDLMSNDKIIETATLSVVEKDGYEGTPPIPSFEQIQAFTAEGPGNDWVVFVLERPGSSRYDVHSISEDTKRLELARRIMLQRSFTSEPPETSEEQIWAMANILHKGTTPEHLRQDFYKVDPTHFEPIAKFITRTAGEPTPERLQWLQKAWEKAREDHPDLKIPHPLSTIIRAWLQEQTAKHINREYDRRHPVAIIEKSVLGSIRDVVLDMEGAGNLPIITEQTPELQQLDIWESEDPLPSVLPWSRLLWDGISLQTKSGAVSHGVCVADEVFMELNTGEWEGRQRWELGTLLRALHPNLTEKQLTSNRKKYLTHVIKGIQETEKLGWKAQMDGESGLYIPIKIRQRFMPTIHSSDDFPIIFEIAIPAAGGAGYMMVEKDVIRRARKKSANQLNAVKTSYWLIDTHGTGKTKEGIAYIIDPTRPVEKRDADGYLIHPETLLRLHNSKGQPLRKITGPEAVRQLPRKKNRPQRNRYKELSPASRIKAVFPEGVPPTMSNSTASKRADMAFDDLADASYFEIEKSKDGSDRWRIMPSDSHVRRYRAIRHAKEKSK